MIAVETIMNNKKSKSQDANTTYVNGALLYLPRVSLSSGKGGEVECGACTFCNKSPPLDYNERHTLRFD